MNAIVISLLSAFSIASPAKPRWAFVTAFDKYRTIERVSFDAVSKLPSNIKLENGETINIVRPQDPLKVEYEFVDKFYEDFINKNRADPPSFIMHVGYYGSNVTELEPYASNYISRDTEDSSNRIPENPNIEDSKKLKFKRYTFLDVESIVSKLRTIQHPNSNSTISVVTSNSGAGDYVCNYIFYKGLKWIQDNHLNIPILFAHLARPNATNTDENAFLLEQTIRNVFQNPTNYCEFFNIST